MLKFKLLTLYYALQIATCSCQLEEKRGFENLNYPSSISRVGKLPKIINESSGLAMAKNGEFWTHNDGGGKPTLYQINNKGYLSSTYTINNSKNKDWEDLTTDTAGNIYIGDFGNNYQNRKDLLIYKVNGKQTSKIKFQYADQKSFPAETKNFDCEAFFWYKGELHLFTKGWERKKGITKHYVLSDKPGEYQISPKDSFPVDEMVTAADISPDGQLFALLTYGKVLLFGIESGEINFQKPVGCIKTKRKQTEAIIFTDNNTLLFTNEQGGFYKIKLQ